MQEDLFLPQCYESHAHVEQVVLVALVHEEVEDLVDQRDVHISACGRRYLAKTVSISCVTTMERGISWLRKVW